MFAGACRVVELAEQFGVVQETVRRDLAKLDKNGIARKVHGGAVCSQSKFEESLASRLERGVPEKHKLCIVNLGRFRAGAVRQLDLSWRLAKRPKPSGLFFRRIGKSFVWNAA